MNDQNKNEDKKTNEEIRKEIEQLEKLIEKVKEQNKKKKRNNGPGNPILRINLAAVYSRNLYINLIIGFLVNFITFFVISRVIGHLFFDGAYNDIHLILVVIGLTLFEELYKKILFKFFMPVVIYSVGTIFFLLNVLYFYLVDSIFFGFRWFISAYHPILFVLTYTFFRYMIKLLYKQLEIYINKNSRR